MHESARSRLPCCCNNNIIIVSIVVVSLGLRLLEKRARGKGDERMQSLTQHSSRARW